MSRQRHDTSMALSLLLVEIVAAALRPEEISECRAEFYEAVLAALEKHDVLSDRYLERLSPSEN